MPAESISVIILSFLISFITTLFILKYGKNVGLYDRSGGEERRADERSRFGGVGIYLAIVVSLGITFLFSSQFSGRILGNLKENLALFGCVSSIFALGLYDDLKGADARKKLLIQAFAATLLYLFGYKISVISNPFGFILGPESLILPDFAGFLLTLFWLVGITNAFNLVDGIDGLAPGVAIICSLTMIVISFHLGHPLIGLLFIAVAGASCGFLPYNMPKAKIIMGDSGSLTLGFLFAALSLKGSLKGSFGLAFMIPILILIPAILDTIWAATRRWIQGRPFHSADLDHIHHRMMRFFDGRARHLFALYGTYLGFCALALLLTFLPGKELVSLIYLLSLLIIIILFLKIGYFHDLGEWLWVRRCGKGMIEAREAQDLWGLLVKTLKRLGFCGASMEIDKALKPKAGSKREEKSTFVWQMEDKGQNPRSIQLTLDLEDKGENMGRLILEKNPGYSKLSPNPSPTIEMIQKYVSQGLEKIIHS